MNHYLPSIMAALVSVLSTPVLSHILVSPYPPENAYEAFWHKTEIVMTFFFALYLAYFAWLLFETLDFFFSQI
jgi:hypothetical protein